MAQRSNYRDVKVALSSLKMVLDSIQNQHLQQAQNDQSHGTHGNLQMTLRKMRTSKLGEVFVQKLERTNIFNHATYLHIMSEKQRNDNRLFHCKGVAVDAKVISFVYILDIIFCLVTFVTGSFRAFIEAFQASGDSTSGVFLGLMISAIVVTSFKIIINSITITIQDGILLQYLSDILIHYVKSRLIFIDIGYVAINIALLIVNNQSQPLSIVLFIISIIKLFTLYENLRTFETTFINSFKKQQYFNLLKVALFNIFFAHFVCCMLLAMSLIDPENNWRIVKGINQEQWYVQYIWAFYWACTIIMTVGFGDFSAFFFKEAIIVSFIELFSCIVLAFNISEIGSIIMSIRSSQTEYRRKIAIFKRMAKENHINEELQRRIQAYLKEQTTIKETFEFNQQNELLEQIPQNLRNQYVVEANKVLFPDLPFFKNLQKNTLIKFTEKFSGKVYYPGQYLMKLEEGNDSIMILKSGKVGLAYKKYGSYLNGTIVQEVKVDLKQVNNPDGSYEKKMVPILLNTDFLSQTKKIDYDMIARKYSFVYKITYDDFFQVIKLSQIDSEYYFSIRHKHNLIQNEWEQLKCGYCSRPDDESDDDDYESSKLDRSKQSRLITKNDKQKYHTKFSCPKLHYFSLRGISVLRSIRNYGAEQKRDAQYYRGKKRLLGCLIIRKSFFRAYEQARNFASKKKRNQENEERKLFLKQARENKGLKMESPKSEQERLEQIQAIERVVREAIEEGLTGYKPQFWDLEIDKLYNYTNYFATDNPKDLDFVELNKVRGKNLRTNASSSKFFRGKTVLNLIKDIENQRN